MLHIYNLNWGFNVGEIIDTSLLNSLLLSWDGILDKETSIKKTFKYCASYFITKFKK